jgi:hypothetical protein
MKKLFVAFSAVALVVAVNFGLASAHPFADPTPPQADVDQQGDHQDGNSDQSQAGDTNEQVGDLNETDMNESGDQGQTGDAAGNATTTTAQNQQGDQGQQDRNTEQDGEFEGDN